MMPYLGSPEWRRDVFRAFSNYACSHRATVKRKKGKRCMSKR